MIPVLFGVRIRMLDRIDEYFIILSCAPILFRIWNEAVLKTLNQALCNQFDVRVQWMHNKKKLSCFTEYVRNAHWIAIEKHAMVHS